MVVFPRRGYDPWRGNERVLPFIRRRGRRSSCHYVIYVHCVDQLVVWPYSDNAKALTLWSVHTLSEVMSVDTLERV